MLRHVSLEEPTRRRSVLLEGVWLLEILKSPPEKTIPQLNRHPHSKSPTLGERWGREGWGTSDVAVVEGGVCRQRADTIKTLKNELLNTSIKKYKTWPQFLMLPGLLCRRLIRC